jgi:hypothetical protein
LIWLKIPDECGLAGRWLIEVALDTHKKLDAFRAAVKTPLNKTGEDDRLAIDAVILSTLFIGFGGGVVFPILPNLGAVLGISPFLVGFILSANRFARLLANAPTGTLVDRFRTRKPFVVGVIIQGISTAGNIIASTCQSVVMIDPRIEIH